jgi:hypothetical protein
MSCNCAPGPGAFLMTRLAAVTDIPPSAGRVYLLMTAVSLQGMAPYLGQAPCLALRSWAEWPRRLAVKGGVLRRFRSLKSSGVPLTVRGATAQSRGHPRTRRRASPVPPVPLVNLSYSSKPASSVRGRGPAWLVNPQWRAARRIDRTGVSGRTRCIACRSPNCPGAWDPAAISPVLGGPCLGTGREVTATANLFCYPGAPAGRRVPGTQLWREQLSLDSRTPPCIPWTGTGGGWPNGLNARCTR